MGGMDNPPKPEGWVPPQRGPKKRKADQAPGTPLSSANTNTNGTESGTMTPNSISSMSLLYMGGQDLINVPLRDNRFETLKEKKIKNQMLNIPSVIQSSENNTNESDLSKFF